MQIQTKGSFSILQFPIWRIACRRKKKSKLQCCYIYISVLKVCFYKVFAKSPCAAYLNLKSSEFMARFMSMLKADQEKVPRYLYHLALLVIRNPSVFCIDDDACMHYTCSGNTVG